MRRHNCGLVNALFEPVEIWPQLRASAMERISHY